MKIDRPLTYADLEKTLIHLGFTKHVVNGYVAFDEKEHDALIVLPKTTPEETVRPHHIGMVRMTVTGRGVAEESAFEEALAASSATTP